jgi:hypothetical protein
MHYCYTQIVHITPSDPLPSFCTCTTTKAFCSLPVIIIPHTVFLISGISDNNNHLYTPYEAKRARCHSASYPYYNAWRIPGSELRSGSCNIARLINNTSQWDPAVTQVSKTPSNGFTF